MSNAGQKGTVQQSEGGQRTARGESSEGAGERWLKMATVKEISPKSKTLNCLLFPSSQLPRKPAPTVEKNPRGSTHYGSVYSGSNLKAHCSSIRKSMYD